MSSHAVRAVAEAAAAAREFLLPIERGRWLRLATLALLVGVGWLTPAVARVAIPERAVPGGVAGQFVAIAVGFAVLLTVCADTYGRFALFSALRSDRLRLAENLRWRVGRSIRWLGFAFGAGVLVAAAATVSLRAIRSGWLSITAGDPTTTLGLATTVAAAVLAAGVVLGAVGFAHATLWLLPATMLATGVGALASWRRLWRAFAGHRGGFVGYLLLRGLVALAVGFVALLSVAALAASFAVVAFVVLVACFGTVSNALATVGAVPLGAVAGVSLVAFAVLPVRAAAMTYRAGYDVAVLGRVDPDLALLDPAGTAGLGEDDTVSVVLPADTEAGVGATDGGLESSATDTSPRVADDELSATDAGPSATDAGPSPTGTDSEEVDGAADGMGGFEFGTVESDEG